MKLGKAADVKAGTMKGFVVGDKKVLVANIGGKFYALEDKCSHMGAKLSTGMLLGNIVMCNAHSAQFDLTTGETLSGPGKGAVPRFEVRVSGDDLEVGL